MVKQITNTRKERLNLNEFQKKFILKAIENNELLYDFENTTNKEFKECYNKTKKQVLKELENLRKKIQ